MSADNWATCPVCNTEQARKEKDLYGKIPKEEYEALLAKRDARESTMREDYELGTDEEGTFEVSYSCYCNVCKFNQSFKHRVEWNLTRK